MPFSALNLYRFFEPPMGRVAFILISLLSLVGGCRALDREVKAVEYRPGWQPITTESKCDATYSLNSPEPNTTIGYATIDLPKGASVGYRRELDGSLVAIAGERITPIADSHSVWRYTPKPITRWDRLVVTPRLRVGLTKLPVRLHL